MGQNAKSREVGYCKPPAEHQFKEGNPGGPGRPKTKPLTDALRKALDEDPKAVPAIIRAGLKKAKAGDFRFWAEIFNRIDGKVLEQLDVTSGGNQIPDRPDEFYEWLEQRHRNGRANGRSDPKKRSADS